MSTIASVGATAELLRTALEPVRTALQADAAAEASRIRHDAEMTAQALIEEAQDDVASAVDRTRRTAEQSARARADQAAAQSHRDAHLRLLAAQESLHAEVVERVHAAVRKLPQDPRYPELLDALEDRARRQLGDDAHVDRDTNGGGLTATSGARRVDYGLDALADMALDLQSDEMSKLWR